MLQYLRANLINTFQGGKSKYRKILLVSAPVDFEFELFITSCALNLMKNMLNTKYATTVDQDKQLLKKVSENYRFRLAIIHRLNQKEILVDQIKLLLVLIRILARVKEGATIREAYSRRVDDYESKDSEEEVMFTRIRLRKYLRELDYYQNSLVSKWVEEKEPELISRDD